MVQARRRRKDTSLRNEAAAYIHLTTTATFWQCDRVITARRLAYGRGLVIDQKVGANPYQFGVAGASDFHNALSTSSEAQYTGAIGGTGSEADVPDAKATQGILAGKPTAEAPLAMLITGSGSLTGVWADENTREGIFDALKRKETFATSGTRIKVRFFGGWQYDSKLTSKANWVQTAYAQGSTMGSDLPAKAATAKRPRFVIWAIKDPDGAHLERAQVIKLWQKGEGYEEKIFDVAKGATELASVWEDPEFDPAVAAVYYLRVLEVPTPRWSTILAKKRGLPVPKDQPENIQERAWSSPIWYTPPRAKK